MLEWYYHTNKKDRGLKLESHCIIIQINPKKPIYKSKPTISSSSLNFKDPHLLPPTTPTTFLSLSSLFQCGKSLRFVIFQVALKVPSPPLSTVPPGAFWRLQIHTPRLSYPSCSVSSPLFSFSSQTRTSKPKA